MNDIGPLWHLDSSVLVPSGRMPLSAASGNDQLPIGTTALPINVRRSGDRWEVAWRKDKDEPWTTSLDRTDTLWVGEASSPGPLTTPQNSIGWHGKSWRGRFKLFVNPRGTLTLADRLPLETYLAGVVPGEIGNLGADVLEAGRAQAIAARSYTLYYRGRRASEGFDLYGTVEDQVYGAIQGERPLATQCVQTTHGQIALSNDIPIRANYCATCGGISADVWEAWPADPLPYLVSHRDSEGQADFCSNSPHYRWREEWPVAEFLADVSNFGRLEGVRLPAQGVGELLDVRVLSRSRSGRVWELAVETSKGEILIPAYHLRRVLRRAGNPSSILRSNLFKIDVRRDPATRRASAVVASGAGSGHGVGLCQTGALAMAKQHMNATSIIRHYYPSAELKKMY